MATETTNHAAGETSPGCPGCGGRQLWFRVQRTGVPHRPVQARTIVWECRGCGHSWTEPLVLPTGSDRGPAQPGG